MILPSKYNGPSNTRNRIGNLTLCLIVGGIVSVPCLLLSFNRVHNDLGGAPWTIQDVGYAIGVGLAIPVVVGLFLFIVNKYELTAEDLWRHWPEEDEEDETKV